jgi:SpoVK/Ycf46/Vps4 family AAA+-type ATPase
VVVTTALRCSPPPSQPRCSLLHVASVLSASIGGLESELASVREMVELPLLSPALFASFGVRPPRGVLLYGAAGTGKTLIARAVASASFARFLHISGSEVSSRYVGESESRLRSLFLQAAASAPAVIFIDEIDALCPRRDSASDPLHRRLVSCLLTLMDGMYAMDRVVVMAATNRVDALDPALRRPGRFDREVEIGIPGEKARLHILRLMLRGRAGGELTNTGGCALKEDELQELARVTHGFVGADLQSLCREAAMAAIQRHTQPDIADTFASLSISPPSLGSLSVPSASSASSSSSLQLTYADFLSALKLVRPSSLRSVALDIPTTRWSDIGGQHAVKQRLVETVQWPLTHPQAFARLGIAPPKGVLLYGPPGCSKVNTGTQQRSSSISAFYRLIALLCSLLPNSVRLCWLALWPARASATSSV